MKSLSAGMMSSVMSFYRLVSRDIFLLRDASLAHFLCGGSCYSGACPVMNYSVPFSFNWVFDDIKNGIKCFFWQSHRQERTWDKVSEFSLQGDLQDMLVTPDLTTQLPKSCTEMTFICFVHCQYKQAPLWGACVTAELHISAYAGAPESHPQRC